jgi:hypothetical protein
METSTKIRTSKSGEFESVAEEARRLYLRALRDCLYEQVRSVADIC